MVKRVKTKAVVTSIPKMLALLLLFLYVAGTSELQIIHSIVHDHATSVLHSDQQEQDPCHRSMYHDDKDQGCSHNSHLGELDKCKMCDLICNIHPALVNAQAVKTNVFETGSFTIYSQNIFCCSVIISSSRAPPVA